MSYDVIVIGIGAAGEAAGLLGSSLGASGVGVERELVAGECSFWAYMPSKTLLDSGRWRAQGADYPWERASARRDWMISREPPLDRQDDSGHVHMAAEAGEEVVRGVA